MEKWGVNSTYMVKSKDGQTPIIVERIITSKGAPKSRFEWRCPICGNRFPKCRQLKRDDLSYLMNGTLAPNVFYTDRVSNAIIDLAKYYKSKGSMVFFEPSTIGNECNFLEMARISDILKYSNDRLKTIGIYKRQIKCPLEIETLGSQGIRYRFRTTASARTNWVSQKSFVVKNVTDSVGAGDWCSAGIMQQLFKDGKREMNEIEKDEINRAILYGQALASISCQEEGARGIMYSHDKASVRDEFEELICGTTSSIPSKKKRKSRDASFHNPLNESFCEEFHPALIQNNQKFS